MFRCIAVRELFDSLWQPVIGSQFQGSKLKKNVWLQFATSYENLVTTLKILVVKLIKAIQLINK